jgi:hypothetical protein
MAAMPPFAEQWWQQWRAAASALAINRQRELARLTDAQALAAATELLALAPRYSPSDPRSHTSGLIELQRLLHRAR